MTFYVEHVGYRTLWVWGQLLGYVYDNFFSFTNHNALLKKKLGHSAKHLLFNVQKMKVSQIGFEQHEGEMMIKC